jgi:hypothetical protein
MHKIDYTEFNDTATNKLEWIWNQQDVGIKQSVLLVISSVYSLALQKETVLPFETSVKFYQTTRRYIPEDSNLHSDEHYVSIKWEEILKQLSD